MEGIRIDTDGRVLSLTMDRPGTLNALTEAMSERLAEELAAASTRPEIRVVVLRGAGAAFSSGADLSGQEPHESRESLGDTSLDRANRVIRALVALDEPCVAVVEGVAAGVGCSIALACDLVVAAPSARFLLAFSRIGLMPDGGATATVAASVGRARAMRMALLAEPMSARTAYDAGLVSHLAEEGELERTVREIVERLASGPPLAYAATKRAVNDATLGDLDDALGRERVGQTALLRSRDVAEGIAAFRDKRPARFTGG
ncbi:MAG TPA: enoyl-CoA hydratase [Nocardioidaceae bacterium]|nr:enoyl-CoA hydratase [Nocardioidaceae bacterium]